MKKISIVIISRNEEKNIGRCIESVIEGTSSLKDKEIVLIDSDSVDKTINIAKEYQINIFRLDDSSFLSASAGRYSGFLNTEGEYIFFIDGDMTLDKNWLSIAVPILDKDPEVAGIGGKCRDIYLDENGIFIGEKEDRYDVGNTQKEVDNLGGACLYRRSILDKVGSFNPYLRNEEELELGYRIRTAKYKLLKIPYLMTVHYTKYDIENPSFKQEIKQILREIETGRFTCSGQVLRLLVGDKMIIRYFGEHKRTMIFLTTNLIWLVSFVLFLMINSFFFLKYWSFLMFFMFILRSLKQKSVLNTIMYSTYHYCYSYGLVKGFFFKSTIPKSYLPKLVQVK